MSGFSGHMDVGDLPRRLRGFAAQLLDLRPFWPVAARLGREWFRDQFDSEGGWGGDPWAPLAASTVAKRGSANPILVDTGSLKRAALSPTRIATPTTLELQVVHPVAHWHQDGTSKMPARPIVPSRIPMSAQEELRAEFDQYVDQVAARWGLT